MAKLDEGVTGKTVPGRPWRELYDKKERTYREKKHQKWVKEKGFDVKRDKGGKGFSMTIHKKIKGFEEEAGMAKDRIDEISKGTLRDYQKKAAKDIGKRAYNVGLKGGPENAPEDAMKAEKHAKYIGKAAHRLGGFYRPKYVRERNPRYGGIRKYEGAHSSHKFYKPNEADKTKAAEYNTKWGTDYKASAPYNYKDMGDRERYPRKKGRTGPYRANEEYNEEIEMNEADVEQNEGGEQETMEPNLSDLVVHAIDQKPLDFQQSFAELMQQRIEDAVHEKKLEIAAGYAGANTEFEVEEDDDEVEPEDDDWNGTEYEDEEEEEEDLVPGEPEEE